jgi:polar amino acid transport system substrate-binding protein
MQGAARVAALAVAAALVVACTPPVVQPTPTPTAAASPTAARPRLELSTYEYALQTKGKMRVAIRDGAGNTPLSTRTSAGKIEGFEADIAREVAKAIWGPKDDPDSHIEWVSVDDSTRVAALTSNQADIAIAALAITDDLRKVIDLSDAYYRTGQRFLVKKTNDQINEIADVASGDQTVCAVKGSAAEQNLRKVTNDRAKILELETLDFCMQALSTGAADAITGDELVLFGLVAKDPSTKVVAKTFTDDRLGIGIKKSASADRQGFLDFVNGALLKIVADRTWAKLYETHITPLTGDKKQIPTD